jgi:hypothetical protein
MLHLTSRAMAVLRIQRLLARKLVLDALAVAARLVNHRETLVLLVHEVRCAFLPLVLAGRRPVRAVGGWLACLGLAVVRQGFFIVRARPVDVFLGGLVRRGHFGSEDGELS